MGSGSESRVEHEVSAERKDRASMVVKCTTCGEIRSIVNGAFDALHEFLWRHYPKRSQ